MGAAISSNSRHGRWECLSQHEIGHLDSCICAALSEIACCRRALQVRYPLAQLLSSQQDALLQPCYSLPEQGLPAHRMHQFPRSAQVMQQTRTSCRIVCESYGARANHFGLCRNNMQMDAIEARRFRDVSAFCVECYLKQQYCNKCLSEYITKISCKTLQSLIAIFA